MSTSHPLGQGSGQINSLEALKIAFDGQNPGDTTTMPPDPDDLTDTLVFPVVDATTDANQNPAPTHQDPGNGQTGSSPPTSPGTPSDSLNQTYVPHAGDTVGRQGRSRGQYRHFIGGLLALMVTAGGTLLFVEASERDASSRNTFALPSPAASPFVPSPKADTTPSASPPHTPSPTPTPSTLRTPSAEASPIVVRGFTPSPKPSRTPKPTITTPRPTPLPSTESSSKSPESISSHTARVLIVDPDSTTTEKVEQLERNDPDAKILCKVDTQIDPADTIEPNQPLDDDDKVGRHPNEYRDNTDATEFPWWNTTKGKAKLAQISDKMRSAHRSFCDGQLVELGNPPRDTTLASTAGIAKLALAITDKSPDRVKEIAFSYGDSASLKKAGDWLDTQHDAIGRYHIYSGYDDTGDTAVLGLIKKSEG